MEFGFHPRVGVSCPTIIYYSLTALLKRLGRQEMTHNELVVSLARAEPASALRRAC